MARWNMTVERDGSAVQATYGYDRALGLFLEVRSPGGRLVEYDALGDGYDGLPGLIDALIESGVFSRNQVEEALEAMLMVDSVAEVEDLDIRQIALMVERLKQAAGE